MPSRREFIVRGLGALGGWLIGVDLARQITCLARQKQAYLPKVENPTGVLWAAREGCCSSYILNLGWHEPSFTWRQWLERKGVDFTKSREVEEYFVNQGLYEPDPEEPFRLPDPEAEIPWELLQGYIEGDWRNRESPEAQAFYYLYDLPLVSSTNLSSKPLGGIHFIDGECPGNDLLAVRADNLAAVSGLQQRLLELGENVEIRIRQKQ